MVMHKQLLFLLLLFSTTFLFGQEPSAVLNLESTTEGFLMPRMSTFQRDNIITPSDGMMIFNTSTGYSNYYDGVFNNWREVRPYSPPVATTYYTSYHAIELFTRGNNLEYDTDLSAYGQTGTGGQFFLPVHIPNDADLVEIDITYFRNTTDEYLVRLDKRNTSTYDIDFGLQTVIDSGTNWTTVTIPINENIDNLNFVYYLSIQPTFFDNWAGEDFRIGTIVFRYSN